MNELNLRGKERKNFFLQLWSICDLRARSHTTSKIPTFLVGWKKVGIMWKSTIPLIVGMYSLEKSRSTFKVKYINHCQLWEPAQTNHSPSNVCLEPTWALNHWIRHFPPPPKRHNLAGKNLVMQLNVDQLGGERPRLGRFGILMIQSINSFPPPHNK